jgi:hypothetical protein
VKPPTIEATIRLEFYCDFATSLTAVAAELEHITAMLATYAESDANLHLKGFTVDGIGELVVTEEDGPA